MDGGIREKLVAHALAVAADTPPPPRAADDVS